MVKVAMIGCGDISGIYLKNIIHTFKDVALCGVCNRSPEPAERAAAYVRGQKEAGIDCEIPKIYASLEEVLKDHEIQVILNLTRPNEHYAVTKAALLAGKHVYTEKPLAVDMDEADELIALAENRRLYLGGAPDTFLGAGIQTCRKLIDDGFIGDVIGANVSMICRGHETWHPNPAFYYQRGGGPMMDMGPYYITALINLLGEAKGLVGMTKKSFDKRIITSQPHYGEEIDVEADTYITGNILFSSGAVASVFTTFDVYYPNQSRFEVYGTKGTLIAPDPNSFGGPVLIYRPEDAIRTPSEDTAQFNPYRGFKEIPLMFDYRENSRAIGLADMCRAIETGRECRSNFRQLHHVLEILTGFSKASDEGRYFPLKTRFERSQPMNSVLLHGVLD